MRLLGRELTFAKADKQPQPDMGELARIIAHSQIMAYQWSNVDKDIDPIASGKGLEFYEQQMMADDMCKSAITILKLGVLAGGWEIQPAVGEGEEGYDEAQEIADFIRFCFEDMQGSVEAMLMNITQALVPGFSVQEKNYKLIEGGEWTGMVGLASVKPKPAPSFTFDIDEFGTLKQLFQRLGTVEREPIPLEKLVLYTYDWEGIGLPQGKSILRAAYRHYCSKDTLMRARNVAGERYAAPTPIGTYPVGTPQSKQDDLLAVCKSLMTETAAIMQEGCTVEFLESKGSVMAPYDDSIDSCNKGIARAIFGQVLAADEGSEGAGSYAQAKVHRGILGMYLTALRQEIAETVIYEQIIKPLVDFNFETDLYPKMVLAPPEERDLVALGTMIDLMVKDGVVHPDEPWIREEFGWPAKSREIIAQQEAEKKAKADALAAQQAAAKATAETGTPAAQNPGKDAAEGQSSSRSAPGAKFAHLAHFRKVEPLTKGQARFAGAVDAIFEAQRNAVLQKIEQDVELRMREA